MTIKIGDTIPSATLTTMTTDGPAPVKTEDFFKGRKVIVFFVPGAFTPTCSAKHLPGFVEKFDDIKSKGVDEVACFAVNDVFVMSAWGKASGADGKVTMLADGNAAFTKALGLELDATGFGMGIRSQRFSMVVDDGKVVELNVEEPGGFGLSSADHVLCQI